ncbi:MAG: hypothetical protein HN742_26405 [Lentisphaerae bacterium]|jgi:hypothetical protein|nr:hypothetical protein [Lentisphaerota bacterium]MBT4817923.1 hypothetical protein [Lentisphaerota bacterium]MBT5605995.1 hypothetical protein [Lentisphaerota bacterium]MBT7058616.1 hypothetical protein [Lentisphaerota bacterium]MBT7845434.1 hypothetical protein [Lentisphaerota bacterium]
MRERQLGALAVRSGAFLPEDPNPEGERDALGASPQRTQSGDAHERGLTVRIFASELQAMCRCASEAGNVETGGEVYGFLTRSGDPVVFLATGPGVGARHGTARFQQDIDHFLEWNKLLYDLFSCEFLGRWHWHHSLGGRLPSPVDHVSAASIIRRNELDRFVELILSEDRIGTETRIRVDGHVYEAGCQLRSPLKVMSGISPIRQQLREASELPSAEGLSWQFPRDQIAFTEAGGSDRRHAVSAVDGEPHQEALTMVARDATVVPSNDRAPPARRQSSALRSPAYPDGRTDSRTCRDDARETP